MQKGFTLLELLIVVAIIAVLAAIAIPAMREALVRANIAAAAADAKELHSAFKKFYMDNNMYPYAVSSPAFQLDTFEPLVSMGYHNGHTASRLLNQRADGYDSPDDQGTNREFWLEFSLKIDPSVRFLVADSDDAPLGGGQYFDGICMFRDGVLTKL
jgi:prepilin-type N-terminal cleavage/methylation domain-containing protein